MKRAVPALVAALALLTLLLVPTPASSAPRFSNLDPGGQPRLQEVVPVNVVFVGYDRSVVDEQRFRSGLAETYEPVVRSRLPYGIHEKLGITYSYDYRLTYASTAYEDAFFGQLKLLSRPKARSVWQKAYNAQKRNAVTVKNNYEISAPAVERWLADHPPAGVDTVRNTVFLINWYGRSDFRFHVYTKQGERDPDTGKNFGSSGDHKLIAWGGTTARDEETGLGSTRRVWFHDQSAGPEAWASGWNVDEADLDGDGLPDYRIPPVWEYGHYRLAAALTPDLAKLTRYVALDLLFTTSPLYPVELPTGGLLPRTINIDTNTYEVWDGVDASKKYIKTGLLLSELQELLVGRKLDTDNQDLPFTVEAAQCYNLLALASCYPDSGYPASANLYLQNTKDLARTKDDGDKVDYELPIFSYVMGDDDEGTVSSLGFADDNYVDGTQSYVFAFLSPAGVRRGYGLTTTIIHEVGHHVGLSHPHDGYDSETGLDYVPSGLYYFAQAGDESNTMMSYIDLNWDFSQFDQDNLYRFQSAAAVEAANRLAAAALAARHPERAAALLTAADAAVGRAQLSFADHAYRTALSRGTSAYDLALRAAKAAGADLAPVREQQLARRAHPRAAAIHQPGPFIDPLDHGPRGRR